MAYKITYGQRNGQANTCRRIKLKEKQSNMRTIIAVVFCVVCCGLLIFELYRSVIIPGKSEGIQQAFSTLTNELQQGKPVGDAISAFYEEILTGAGT